MRHGESPLLVVDFGNPRIPKPRIDKTRFVAHMAVAAFLVHYIYKKYKQGKLGRSHIFTDLKAAAAAFLAYHEIKKAYDLGLTKPTKQTS